MKQTKTYHEVVQKLREFFLSKNYVEVPTQSRLSILAACENPFSISTYELMLNSMFKLKWKIEGRNKNSVQYLILRKKKE